MAKAQPVVAVNYNGDVVIVTIDREKILEEKDIANLEATFTPLIEENDPVKMVVDFSRVEYLSSSVLGLLIRLNNTIKERNGSMCLCNISSRIFGIFKITRLDKVFSVFETTEQAVLHLKGN
jgi:anti-sigma B factor antagonist